MKNGDDPMGLALTEEEAFALLTMCLTSPHKLDATAEKALRKLAQYCRNHSNDNVIDIEQYKPNLA